MGKTTNPHSVLRDMQEKEAQRKFLENLRMQVIISIYTEMIGQTARQNRNVEQVAPELAKKSILCADELIRSLSPEAAADRT